MIFSANKDIEYNKSTFVLISIFFLSIIIEHNVYDFRIAQINNLQHKTILNHSHNEEHHNHELFINNSTAYRCKSNTKIEFAEFQCIIPNSMLFSVIWKPPENLI